jgi:MarR family transcriptional regulator, lower aerobic nicotinate degradation pathway regulator
MRSDDSDGPVPIPAVGGLAFQTGLGYLLSKTGAVARQRWSEALAEADLSRNQAQAMLAVAETGPVSQQFLAGAIGVDPRNVVPILDSLESRGLVSRTTDPADRRRRLIAVTSAGRRVVARLMTLLDDIEQVLMAPLPPADREELRRLLGRVLDGARSGS